LLAKKEIRCAARRTTYCIEGISETTGASADFYCQSNTNNHTRTSYASYAKSLQVNHRQNTQKERELFSEWGEGEREETEGEGMASVFIGDNYFCVLTIILNQHQIFWDIATGHISTKLFQDACKYYNRCPGLFLSNGFSGAMTSTQITMRFSINL
jgi:hypothetical protein